MPRNPEVKRTMRGALSGEEAEELFTTVDETGHTNKERAKNQHSHREEKGTSLDIDPLAGEDPSGANTDRLITRSAIIFVTVFLFLVVISQVGWGYVRRVTTTTLAEDASMRSVVSALNMGVEWGGGFTQFPAEFTVQEADEHTHRIEVTVTDSTSSSELEAFATAQVQASAFSVNALLNPNIDTVVYHVRVRRDKQGHFQKSAFFGFLRPTGAATPFMTFVWSKRAADDGVRFDCTITGVDSATQERLHETITSKSTPGAIISYVIGDNGAVVAQNVMLAASDNDGLAEQISLMADEAATKASEQAADANQTEETVTEGESEDSSDSPTTAENSDAIK
ncbi:MAG: hypothetical protein Q4C09_08400 [Atopobiaceae bacterium]|nr:hypothetical protein [Atopobiaceae bacterium]